MKKIYITPIIDSFIIGTENLLQTVSKPIYETTVANDFTLEGPTVTQQQSTTGEGMNDSKHNSYSSIQLFDEY